MISYSIISHTHTLYKEEALAEYVQTSLHKKKKISLKTGNIVWGPKDELT